MKNVIVLGLGRFGAALARKLFEKNIEVMAVDRDYNKVQKIADSVTYACQADMTDAVALKSLGINNYDVAIIGTGSSLESSIEATLICKDEGVETVIAKAVSETHARILEKIGADKIIFPERDTGERLARVIAGSNLLEFIQFSSNFSLAEIRAHATWVGKSLKELNFRKRYEVNVVAFERNGDTLISPDADMLIEKDDVVVLLGEAKKISALEEAKNQENEKAFHKAL